MSGTPPALARFLAGTDFFRRSPSRLGGRSGHKEWHHFLVHAPGAHLLINFNLIDEKWAEGAMQGEVARLIVIARGEAWEGDVERFDAGEVEVTPGRIDARFGRNTLRFVDGAFHVSVALRERPLSADLELIPTSRPAVSLNQPLAPSRSLSWLFVPRLRARGTLTLGGQTVRFEGSPAYHDHNWGHFLWGDDFSWEWGSAHPLDAGNPWSVVHVRMADQARSVARYQGLFLWHGYEPLRVFRDEEIRVSTPGGFEVRRPFTLPRVMALLAPGSAADLPGTLELTAQGRGDSLRFTFQPEDMARLVTPSEAHPERVSIIHEVFGRVSMRGRVRGETVEMEGPSVFEFIRD